MSTSRRRILQGAGLGPLMGLWPGRSLAYGKKKKNRDVYRELRLRPVINFQGTYTSIGASKQVPELFEAQAQAAGLKISLIRRTTTFSSPASFMKTVSAPVRPARLRPCDRPSTASA